MVKPTPPSFRYLGTIAVSFVSQLAPQFLSKSQISNLKLKISRGYTLIELLIILVISGVIGVLSFFGIRSFNNYDAVVNAQKQFLTSARLLQNQVNNGALGLSVQTISLPGSGSTYTVGSGSPVNLSSKGITITNSLAQAIKICFAHPAITSYSATYLCGTCTSGAGYVCDSNSTIQNPARVTVTFTLGSIQKMVQIEGSGMTVTRIYDQ